MPWSRDPDSVSMVTWSRYRVILRFQPNFQPNYLFRSSYEAIAYSTILWCQTYLRINLQSRSWRWLGGEASPLLEATGLLEAQWCNEDGNGLGLKMRPTSQRPRTYSKDIKARSMTRWTQQDRLSVGETSASNLLTTIVPKSKDEDLVEASSRWCKRSAPLRHPDKWSTRLWEKLTDDRYTHPSSTRHFDGLVYGRSWPTTDVRIFNQRGTQTR